MSMNSAVKHILSGTASSLFESPGSSFEDRTKNVLSFGYSGRQEEIGAETELNNQIEAAQIAADSKASKDKITAAAEATAAKLRKRKGMKATILTDDDPTIMSSANTQSAELLGA